MKKGLIILTVVWILSFSGIVLAQEQFSPDTGAVGDDVVDIAGESINENALMDEGYGNDEEYFGAEVGGVDEGYLDDDQELIANAEAVNVVVQ